MLPQPARSRRSQTPWGKALFPAALFAILLLMMAGCGRNGPSSEEGRVKLAFQSCQSALANQQAGQVLPYIPKNVRDYLEQLNATKAAGSALQSKPNNAPSVDLLLHTALERKVPADLRGRLTLDLLLQRIADKHLLNPRDVREIELGRVTVNGEKASAELYYQGTLTALRLPFLKEDNNWKVDVMAILPYAEVLMRLDRAIKGETEARQVEQLVSKLPSL